MIPFSKWESSSVSQILCHQRCTTPSRSLAESMITFKGRIFFSPVQSRKTDSLGHQVVCPVRFEDRICPQVFDLHWNSHPHQPRPYTDHNRTCCEGANGWLWRCWARPLHRLALCVSQHSGVFKEEEDWPLESMWRWMNPYSRGKGSWF